MRCLPLLALAVWYTGIRPVAAQTPVAAPGGTLRGTVVDSATGQPVGYALVIWVERDNRVFATESGRFSLAGLGAGVATLRIQQIGYRAIARRFNVETRPTASGPPALVIPLSRQAVVLPEVVVRGSVCARDGDAQAEDGSILDEAFKNAERIGTLEKRFPFLLKYQRVVTLFDSNSHRLGGSVDTVLKDSRTFTPYRKGRLLSDAGGRRERVSAFSISDVAGEEFRKHHCFWYAGKDSVDGFPGYRIEFSPTPETRTIDWAGSILVDSASMRLLLAEARLVNIPGTGTNFRSATCTFLYALIVPSLPQEFQARCVSVQKGTPPHVRVERWLLVERSFVKGPPVLPDRS